MQRENALIFYQTLSTYSLWKCVETSLKNLKVDSGAQRVNDLLRLQLLKIKTLERVFTKKTDIKRRTNKMLLYLKIALWLMNTTIESVENRNRNTEADIMNSPTIYRK